jgi:glycosyltransferase involved in cell wall biosynthesis
MHILVTADTLGGVWTYTRELVTGLARRGVRVTLVSFGDILPDEQTRWTRDLPGLDYRPTAFKLEWMQNSEQDMEASAEYLCAVVRETRPDLLHFSQFFYGALAGDAAEVPRVVVAHSDVVSWWHAVHKQKPVESPWLRWYREIVQRGLAGASAVVAPSRWMLQQIELHFGKLARATVVHNGRDHTLFDPQQPKENFIVTVGRLWDTGKNARLLLAGEMPGPVHIIGAAAHPELQSAAFDAEEIRPNVHLEAPADQEELAGLFSRAAIYAATSQYEPFGLAPLEAALSGCALVVSDIPSFRELWDGAAVFFPNGDAQHLRDVLAELLRDPELRQRHAALAYERARRKYSSARMIESYLELYHSLAPVALVAS